MPMLGSGGSGGSGAASVAVFVFPSEADWPRPTDNKAADKRMAF